MNRYNIEGSENVCNWLYGCCWCCSIMQTYVLLRSVGVQARKVPVVAAGDETAPITEQPKGDLLMITPAPR